MGKGGNVRFITKGEEWPTGREHGRHTGLGAWEDLSAWRRPRDSDEAFGQGHLEVGAVLWRGDGRKERERDQGIRDSIEPMLAFSFDLVRVRVPVIVSSFC
jgi:hypothetical protein